MPLRDEHLHAHLRALQFRWIVVFGGLAAAVVLAAAVARLWPPPLVGISGTVFYTSAFLNLGAMIWAFFAQYRLHEAVQAKMLSPAERLAAADYWARRAILPLAAAGFFAVGGALTTGEWIQIAFILPIVGFALLFYPTRRRVGRYLHVNEHPHTEDVEI